MPLLSPAFRRSHFRRRCQYVRNDARDPSSERWNCGRERCPLILPKLRLPRNGSFTCRKSTTWDRRLYFPSEGRRAEDFFALKIRRLRPRFNPRTWVLKASTLPLDHRMTYTVLKLRVFLKQMRHCQLLKTLRTCRQSKAKSTYNCCRHNDG